MRQVMSIDFRNTFPVFPLPDSVLLPNALMTLRIFEARYVQMVSECLDSYGLIAMALFRHDVEAGEYFHGKPALRQYVGLGHICHYERVGSDRYVIVLQGVCRARTISETASRSYRRVHLEPIDVARHDETRLAALRERLESLLEDPLLGRTVSLRDLQEDWPCDDVSTSALVDVVASKIEVSTATRYRLLAEPDPSRRAGWLIGYLQALRRTLAKDS